MKPETNQNKKMKIEYRKDNPHNGQHKTLGTIIKDDGELIDLTQQAYINQGGTPTSCWYEAHAVSRTKKDDDGEPIEYRVTWEIINEDAEEEEDACDWETFEIEEA